MPKSRTHFEQIPIEVVKKIAEKEACNEKRKIWMAQSGAVKIVTTTAPHKLDGNRLAVCRIPNGKSPSKRR